MSLFGNFISSLRQFVVRTPQIQPVRHRYWAEKKQYIRRYGYEDNLARRGLLPHYGDQRVMQLPLYKYVFPLKIYFEITIARISNVLLFLSGQKMCGTSDEHCSVKMTTSIFSEMTVCTRPDNCMSYQHGFVEPKEMNTKFCCVSVEYLRVQRFPHSAQPNGVTSTNALNICIGSWIAKQERPSPTEIRDEIVLVFCYTII